MGLHSKIFNFLRYEESIFKTYKQKCHFFFFFYRHAETYEAVILFGGVLGESAQRLHLRGQGSYDGKHEAILNV